MTTDQTIRSLVQYRENLPLEIDYDLIEYLAAMSNTPTLVNEANSLPRYFAYFEILERAWIILLTESGGIGIYLNP